MNDTELDELLDEWKMPAPSPELREGLRAKFVAVETVTVAGLRGWKGSLMVGARRAMLAAAIVVVGVFLFSVAQALSQTPPPGKIPYTVESEYLLYEDDAPPTVAMVTTSYTDHEGAEKILSRSMPNRQPVITLIGRKLDALLPVWQRMITPFVVSPKELEAYRKKTGFQEVIVVPGCADSNCLIITHWGVPRGVGGTGTTACMVGKVVGVETILGHQTTAVETNSRPYRLTMWLAPDLGCFALRINSERMRPDGSFHVWQTKQAVKVTMNP